MTDLILDFDWIDPQGAKVAELRATWARLSIIVRRHPVTRVYDARLKSVRDSVYVPLYPMAEWLVTQWWSLWNEPWPPSTDRPNYNTRHSLVSAREGYALPSLQIRPAGSMVMLSWSPEPLAFHGLEFTGHGSFWVETRLVKREFSSLIAAVVARLEANGIDDTLLQEDWAAIQSADADERKFCKCAGALGLDPYSLDEDQQSEIEEAGNRIPEEIVAEFFPAATKEELIADADEIHEALSRAQSNSADLTSLKELRQLATEWHEGPAVKPWDHGYSFAQRLRSHLGLDGKPLKSIPEVGDAVGIKEEILVPLVYRFSSRMKPFAALMGINDKSSPAFVLRQAALPSSELFHFCRVLFEYLSSPIRRSALVTNANTDEQKRNRAFAAELLAPASALRTRVSTSVVSGEQTEELAAEFGVSVYVIEHQLVNHRIATIQPSWELEGEQA
jgi:hypothetical protein